MSHEDVEVVQGGHSRGTLESVYAAGEIAKAEYRPATQRNRGRGSVFAGYEGIRRWLSELHDLYEDLSSEILEVRDPEARVVVVFLVRGRGAGSGVTLEQLLAQVVTLRQGKVIEIREYFSREAALEAAGLRE